jgi:hypothetical protein
VIYLRYIFGAVLKISYVSLPRITILTSSSISALQKAPGTSTTATSFSLKESVVNVLRTALSETVGDVTSPGVAFSHCLQPLIVPYHFSLKNMIDSNAPSFWTGLSLLSSYGVNVSIMCSCRSSLDTLPHQLS